MASATMPAQRFRPDLMIWQKRHRSAAICAEGSAGRAISAPVRLAALLGLGLLSACMPMGRSESVVPKPRPAAMVAPAAPSAASAELRQYYRVLQQDLLTRGLLRTDGGGPDTPYDAEDLAENFEAISFFNEYAGRGGGATGGLSRWSGPVRLQAEFGPTIPESQRRADGARVAEYAMRLGRITNHPVAAVAKRGNFHVIFASKDDSAFVAKRVRELLPNISQNDFQLFVNPPRTHYCFVLAGGAQGSPFDYIRGVALIRAEHPDLVRQSCIHEEIAQGLGLLNDSPRARPSIFNDDDEFAFLTSHDEKLLQMLYDPRLKTGMSAEEARPITRIIAREIMGQPL